MSQLLRYTFVPHPCSHSRQRGGRSRLQRPAPHLVVVVLRERHDPLLAGSHVGRRRCDLQEHVVPGEEVPDVGAAFPEPRGHLGHGRAHPAAHGRRLPPQRPSEARDPQAPRPPCPSSPPRPAAAGAARSSPLPPGDRGAERAVVGAVAVPQDGGGPLLLVVFVLVGGGGELLELAVGEAARHRERAGRQRHGW
jgi:hypothetical protein